MKRKIARVAISVLQVIALFFVTMGIITIGVALYMNIFEGVFEGLAMIMWALLAWGVLWYGKSYV